jgi:8-oxo-dGTP pyrophosphatase MutT (NUDIX family)
MHRNPLIQQLQEYQTRWPEEAALAQRFIRFLTDHDDGFERELQVGHVTGSAWLVNRAGTHILLTHHKKLNIWVQLGGHADGDSDLLRVSMREAEEESGLSEIVPVSTQIFDIDAHAIPRRGDFPEHTHWDIRYALQAKGNEDYVVSEESHDLRWVEIATLPGFTQEATLLRMAAKWLEREEF